MKKQIVACIAMALVLTGCMAGKDAASDDVMGTAEASAIASTSLPSAAVRNSPLLFKSFSAFQ